MSKYERTNTKNTKIFLGGTQLSTITANDVAGNGNQFSKFGYVPLNAQRKDR